SLSNDEFWTYAQRDQGRETNVRARGVFAVADSDEWADKSFSGTFNSTLVSPAYTVTGWATAKLSYGSHYLQEGNQRGTATVAFNGGAQTVLKTYSADGRAQIENLTIAVPAGATSMVVRWTLSNANNNWYWAMDNPSVTRAS